MALQTKSGVEVYRQADAARRLKVSRQRVYQMMREGKLAYVDQDGYRYVTADSLRQEQMRLNSLVRILGGVR